jgi:hypothetical protein
VYAIQSGGATYILMTSSNPEAQGSLSLCWRDDGYFAYPRWAPQAIGPGYVLARAESSRPIKFPKE